MESLRKGWTLFGRGCDIESWGVHDKEERKRLRGFYGRVLGHHLEIEKLEDFREASVEDPLHWKRDLGLPTIDIEEKMRHFD